MAGWRIQDVDLSDRTEALLRLAPAGAVLLGCRLGETAERHLRAGDALVFPVIPKMPVDPYRASLYSAPELYDGIDRAAYDTTLDARIYAWSRMGGAASRNVDATLARALHDNAIAEALDEVLASKRVVGVMGGHAVERSSADYLAAAHLGRGLARASLLVLTGGGPGAMEAANLGAYLANADDEALAQAVAILGRQPSFRPSVTRWARAAFAVRERWPAGCPSVGVPTWFYGHEPPNVFASAIAKYFHNALREDVILHRSSAGIVFLPGAAGTVQEIFQEACENYYADAATVAPMVLVGREHWTTDVPAWPLLARLGRDRPMGAALTLVDSVGEALQILAPA